MNITAIYKNGVDEAKDQAAFAIGKKFNAKLQGSGCCLFKPFERDLEWIVGAKEASAMARALRKAGFKVQS